MTGLRMSTMPDKDVNILYRTCYMSNCQAPAHVCNKSQFESLITNPSLIPCAVLIAANKKIITNKKLIRLISQTRYDI